MLKDEGEEMFKRYRALKKHLMEQKDFEGLKLMIEALKGSSNLITSLIGYNNRMFEYCNEITEEIKNAK